MTTQDNGAPRSLIKYQSEIQISENIQQYKKARKNQKVLDPKPSAEDVLNNMIPPRDWINNQNKFFMQYVSHQKSSREQVMKLKQALDDELNYRQARKQGICPIRQQLFSEAFDQIIRQVTINCPQRGLLLMRVRDEQKMTIAAYQTLYQSSINYGMRKQIESEQGMDELEQQLKQYQKVMKDLQRKRIELLSKKQSLQKKILERKTIQKDKREDQIKMIMFQAEQLKNFLDTVKIEPKQANPATAKQ